MNDVAVKSRRSTKQSVSKRRQTALADDQQAPIMLSAENLPKDNTAVPKYFTFNETGNIMLSTTVKDSNQISAETMGMFEEVAVFFAAMTKAMQESNKDLYDYHALDAIVRNSGLFIEVDEESYDFKQKSAGMSFNTELIAAVLGIAATDGAALIFAQKLLQTLGKQADIKASSTSSEDKVGHLLFVCEYLMGMPFVSALLFEIDKTTASKAFTAGPCASGKSYEQNVKFQKATFMFVLPKILREYSGDLLSVDSDQGYGDLVKSLKKALKN